jgi:hypothetical protein
MNEDVRSKGVARAAAVGLCTGVAVLVLWAQSQAPTVGFTTSPGTWFAVDEAATRLWVGSVGLGLLGALPGAAAWYLLVERRRLLRRLGAVPAPARDRLGRRLARLWFLVCSASVLVVALLVSSDGPLAIKQIVDGAAVAIPANAARRVVVVLAEVAALIVLNGLVATALLSRGDKGGE